MTSATGAAATWQHVATHIVVDCPEYRWELEEHRSSEDQQMLFAHIQVRKLAPGLLKQMRATYGHFRQCVSAPLYAVAGEVDDDKWERFVRNFGFKYLMDVTCENGQRRRLFVSNKEEQQHHVGTVLPGHQQDRDGQSTDQPVGRASALSDAGISGRL